MARRLERAVTGGDEIVAEIVSPPHDVSGSDVMAEVGVVWNEYGHQADENHFLGRGRTRHCHGN